MIAIVDYRAGNLTSVKLALDAVGAEAFITSQADEIRGADRVVFPGVGAAGASMTALRELGLEDVIPEVIARGVPFLGVCVGMQLLLESSEEDGGTRTLGILPGRVRRFAPKSRWDKIPQIGWNAVRYTRGHPLLGGVPAGSEMYFVHSYYCELDDASLVYGRTDYADVSFVAAAGRGNVFATQFHPERSGRIGQQIYARFAEWDGTC